MQENQAQIKSRMLRTAAKVWGHPETEAETAFDPLVSLMLAVNASEFERVSNDIHQSNTRVLQQMVQLLAPDALTGPLPAHALMNTISADASTSLSPMDQFFVPVRQVAATETGIQEKWKDYFFTPTAKAYITKCSIRYMAVGNRLFRTSNSLSKEILAISDKTSLSPSTLWLGIDGPGINLNNSQFCFQLSNEAAQTVFYNHLPNAKWFFGYNEPLQHKAGYNDAEANADKLNIEQLLKQQNNLTHKMLQQVNALYRHLFITINDNAAVTTNIQQPLPDEIATSFSPTIIQEINKSNVRWIRIVFPENVANNLLEQVNCSINTFPVVNRHLHESTHRIQDIVNILPLLTDELFFDLHEVSDSDGRLLNVRDLKNERKNDISIMLRRGGVGRFDERDGAAIIEHLIQLLRDESASFAMLGKDFISSELKLLQQTINKLEQQMLSLNPANEKASYLIVRGSQKSAIRNLLVTYWSVAGSNANDIKAGTNLIPYKTASVDHNKTQLVTATTGGRARLGSTESIIAYKSAVLSRERIISQEDVRLFCMLQLGDKVENVTVSKGVMIAADNSQGYKKTVDVRILLERKAYEEATAKKELDYWKQMLNMQLTERSATLLPYRIFFDEPQKA
jgi:hypothetical protein